MKLCTIDDCERPGIARGWCSKHYERWRRTGDPGDADEPARPAPPPEFSPRTKLLCLAPRELERRARGAGRPDLADELVAAWDLRNGSRQPMLVRAASERIVARLLEDEIHTPMH